MIIDAHAHIFPDKIAKKATDAIGDFYGIQMTESAGTPDVLLQEGRLAGITKFVVHSTATTVKQVENINKYIVSETEAHPEFIGFMTLHPDMDEEDMDSEIRFAISHGIRGVKLHPDFQKFAIDEPRAEKIYKTLDGRLPILFHTGDKRYNFSNPERLAKIAKNILRKSSSARISAAIPNGKVRFCTKALTTYISTRRRRSPSLTKPRR